MYENVSLDYNAFLWNENKKYERILKRKQMWHC